MTDSLPRTRQATYNRRYRERHGARARNLNAVRMRRFRAFGKNVAIKRRYEQSDEGRLKTNARMRLRRAVRAGRVAQLPCEICGDPTSQAHHPFGYVDNLALAVWWLCRYHHDRMHR